MIKEELRIYPEKIEKHTENYKMAKHTLKTAFPKKEQVPFWALQLFANNPVVDSFAWYDNDGNYVGMSYSVHHNKKLMILFLALEENARCKGYGSNIIKYLQEKDGIEESVLDIESPLQEATNKEQRERRQFFYERLGFHSSSYQIVEPACNYLIMGAGSSSEKSVKNYMELTDLLTKGVCKLKIEKC